MKRVPVIAAAIVVAILAVWSWRSSARAPKTAARTHAAAGTRAPVATAPAAQGGGVRLVQSERARQMAAAFDAGVLPAPLEAPGDEPDVQAETLAEAVSAGDAKSTAALVAAALASGFDVRGDDGRLQQAPDGRRRGIAMDAWELAATAKLYGEGYGVGLDRVSNAFMAGVPSLRASGFGDAILSGLRQASTSANPSLRFWSHFVAELGRRSPAPFDLLAPRASQDVRLDPVQLLFILKPLAGELAGLSHRATGSAAPAGRSPSPAEAHAWSLLPGWLETPVAAQTPPCNPDNLTGLITDDAALVSTTAFGQIAEYLKAHEVGGIGAYAEGTAAANTILMVLKFIGTYAALDVNVTMDGKTLVRTKTKQPGERRAVTATVAIKAGKWEAFNCVRLGLNLAGLDFSLPSDGPLSNVKVTWMLDVVGGASGIDAVLDTAKHIPDILNGRAHASDYPALVYLDLPDKGPSMDGIQYTDGDGRVRAALVGMPQDEDLSARRVMGIVTRGLVSVIVQVKPTRLTDKSTTAGTIGDMAGNVIAGLTGDVLGAVVGTALEAAYRSQWYPSDPYAFEVKDWDPCHSAWTGTITVEETLNKVQDLSGPFKDPAGNVIGSQKASHTWTTRKQTTYELRPNGPYSSSKARIRRTVYALDRYAGTGTEISCAMYQGGTAHLKWIEERTDEGGGSGTGEMTVNIGSDDTADLDINADNDVTVTIHELRNRDSRSVCANGTTIDENFGGPSELHSSYADHLGFEIHVPVDPKHPDELRGSKTAKQTDGTVVRTTWDLERCANPEGDGQQNQR